MNRQKSLCLMQLGAPNPLEECMSQFSDTNVARKRCHIELFNEKLPKFTTIVYHNLVYFIRIAASNKRYPCIVHNVKLWIIEPCHA